MIGVYEEWMIARIDWSLSRNTDDAKGINQQLYAQMMGWA